METLGDNKRAKKQSEEYYCVSCDYSCSRKYNWSRHILTAKHKNMFQGDTLKKNEQEQKCSDLVLGRLKSVKYAHKNEQKNEQNEQHLLYTKLTCEYCNRGYTSRNGLWKHKKICYTTNITNNDIITMLVKDNSDLKNMIMKFLENGTHNNTTNVNSHNKAFNLNFFLNETCKDAMNITDFVSSIKLNLDDLENTGRTGYIEGITNIILKNLNNIEQHMRPLHCSDHKREILYVKENNRWEKEGEDKPLLTKAIKVIANENIKQIKNWADKNPDCTASNSRKNDLYLKIVSNSMNGLTEEEGKKNIGKIISNLAKELVIQKE